MSHALSAQSCLPATAPLAVSIDGQPFGLTVGPWRDFMPGPQYGSPLLVALWITALDLTAMPASVTLDSAWVTMGDQVWGVIPRQEIPRQPGASLFQTMLRGGPKWPPGASIDVVVRLRGPDGAARCLRAPPAKIGISR